MLALYLINSIVLSTHSIAGVIEIEYEKYCAEYLAETRDPKKCCYILTQPHENQNITCNSKNPVEVVEPFPHPIEGRKLPLIRGLVSGSLTNSLNQYNSTARYGENPSKDSLLISVTVDLLV